MKLSTKKSSLKLLLLFVVPVFLALFLEIIVQEVSFSTANNFFENVLYSLLVFSLVSLLRLFVTSNKVLFVITTLYYLILLFEVGLYLLFQTRMSAAYIHVILSTNFNEISEFTDVYLKRELLWLVLFIIPLIAFFPKRKPLKTNFSTKKIYALTFIFIVVLFLFKFFHLGQWNLPLVSVKSYLEYKKQIEDVKYFKNQDIDVSVTSSLNNETIIIVLGESTSRTHMSLYGYKRQTTPNLDALKDTLLVYKDVISSDVYTTASVRKILTLSNSENLQDNTPLFVYLKKAGYKVFWLSNQRFVGLHDNIISRLAALADQSVYLSHNDFRHKTLFDGVLLDALDKKLKIGGKKVIFLHLIGTHYDYTKRYPLAFSKYSTVINDKRQRVINAYDNAVLYNDFFVSEVINRAKKRKESAVVYLSDHGDEVYDTVDYFGHFDNKPTVNMYKVPFLVYLSQDFRKPKDFKYSPFRKFMLDDFIHSLTHLMGIESESLESERSIFSENFKFRERMVNDSVGFEMFVKKQRKNAKYSNTN